MWLGEGKWGGATATRIGNRTMTRRERLRYITPHVSLMDAVTVIFSLIGCYFINSWLASLVVDINKMISC